MSYTDLTNEYATRHLIEWQTLEQLAQNDAYNHFPAGTLTPFFQASAPLKWTKNTTHDDKALRVVSGAGGGSGGAQALSTNFTLAHSHTIDNHQHSIVNHQHNIHIVSIGSTASPGDGRFIVSADSNGSYLTRALTTGGATTVRKHRAIIDTGGAGTNMGNTNPGSDSQLTDTKFAYFDAIICSKD